MLILVKQREKIIRFFMLNFHIYVLEDKDNFIGGIIRLRLVNISDNRRLKCACVLYVLVGECVVNVGRKVVRCLLRGYYRLYK